MKVKIKQGTKQATRKIRLCEVAAGQYVLYAGAVYQVTRRPGSYASLVAVDETLPSVVMIDHDVGEQIVPLVHTIKFTY